TVGALSTFYPDAKNISDPENRYLQRVRLIAKLPTIAAMIFRHTRGLPYVHPRNELDYIGNYVNMTFEIGGRHEPNPVLQRALEEIGDTKNVPAFIERVKGGEGRLMGFGHRVYKNYDPRAKLIKTIADQVFEQTGLNPKLEIALELERIALEDDYFISRKLYPNVDFYSGLIYQAMGYPTDYFTVLFALGRLPGWIAQWEIGRASCRKECRSGGSA